MPAWMLRLSGDASAIRANIPLSHYIGRRICRLLVIGPAILTRKRAEIAGDLERHEASVRQLKIDLANLDP